MAKADLRRYGLTVSLEEFKESATRELSRFMPGCTVDELVTHPVDALHFCRRINELYFTPIDAPIPDDVILKALMAHRKSGHAKKNNPNAA